MEISDLAFEGKFAPLALSSIYHYVRPGGHLCLGFSFFHCVLNRFGTSQASITFPFVIVYKYFGTVVFPLTMPLASFSKSIIIACVIMPVLATIAVILRFQARRVKTQTPFLDDYIVLVALV